MENKLNMIQKIINYIEPTWCPKSGEKLSVQHGWYGEGRPSCEPCQMTNDCPVVINRI